MAHTVRESPGDAGRGVASGVLFMAVFGTGWATLGVNGVQGWGSPWLLLAALLGGAVLLGGGVALWRGSRRVGTPRAGAEDQDRRREGPWFGGIVAVEGMAIGVAIVLCSVTGHGDLIVPITALIVGLHFFPLAWLVQYRAYYLTGALLCLVALVTLLAVPVTVTVGGREILARWVVVGFGCAVLLWGTGLLLWWHGARVLRSA